MKLGFIAFFCTLLATATYANDLSQAESELLVREIDNICGDTWCEGEFNFAFHELTCDFKLGECEFRFEVIDTLFDSDWNEVGEIRTAAGCYIAAASKELLFNEDMSSYSDYLYETMTECISEAEGEAWSNRD